jgi:DNA primase large subunit
MKKDPEPFIELLYQEFPKTDPIELERITKVVKQWLEQKRKYFEKLSNRVAKKQGENATETYVSKAYPHCIDTLLQELNLRAFATHIQERD